MNSGSDDKNMEYSFGEIPSPQIRQLDHSAWWAAFMSLVGTMPAKSESSRLSDDPVHMIHGHYFSIRDCAVHAIDAAREEKLDQVARNYEEQARQLVFSYDKRVYIRVSRVSDRKRMGYLLICTASLLLSTLLAVIYMFGGKTSRGLLALIIISLILTVSSAVAASLTTWRKRKILHHPSSHSYSDSDDETGIKTDL